MRCDRCEITQRRTLPLADVMGRLLQRNHDRQNVAIDGPCSMACPRGVLSEQAVTGLEGSGLSGARPNFDFSRQHDE